MGERIPQSRLKEGFRKELFRLINQYLSSPEDATLGKIVRTLVNFQEVSAAVGGPMPARLCGSLAPDMGEPVRFAKSSQNRLLDTHARPTARGGAQREGLVESKTDSQLKVVS